MVRQKLCNEYKKKKNCINNKQHCEWKKKQCILSQKFLEDNVIKIFIKTNSLTDEQKLKVFEFLKTILKELHLEGIVKKKPYAIDRYTVKKHYYIVILDLLTAVKVRRKFLLNKKRRGNIAYESIPAILESYFKEEYPKSIRQLKKIQYILNTPDKKEKQNQFNLLDRLEKSILFGWFFPKNYFRNNQ